MFDLNNDPYEKNNLSKQEPELVERLDKEITRWAESVYSEVPDQFARKVQRTNKKNNTLTYIVTMKIEKKQPCWHWELL